jgi:predicted phosphodiesterase
VLGALEARGIREFLCVGDIVGYNADPDECAAHLRSRRTVAIAGNHDLIGTRRLDFARCSNKARYSLKRTRRTLSRDTAAWLERLPPNRLVEENVLLVHGGVRDVEQYMATPAIIGQNADYLRADFPAARLCFFGHSHEQKVYEVAGGAVSELPLSSGRIYLDKQKLVFVNPGSVDAQRKNRHKLAECAIFDTVGWTLEFLRLPYDAASTEAKAAVFGYRINRLTDRLYNLRRRFSRAIVSGNVPTSRGTGRTLDRTWFGAPRARRRRQVPHGNPG